MDQQLVAIALSSAPTMLTVLIGILINNNRMNDVQARISDLRSHMDAGFARVDRRFEEMQDLWRSELRRVE